MNHPMTPEQRQDYPINALLEDIRQHCQTAHSATSEDYGQQVRKWHQINHPTCDASKSMASPTLRRFVDINIA